MKTYELTRPEIVEIVFSLNQRIRAMIDRLGELDPSRPEDELLYNAYEITIENYDTLIRKLEGKS